MRLVPLFEIADGSPDFLDMIARAAKLWKRVTPYMGLVLSDSRLGMYEFFRKAAGYKRENFHMWVKPASMTDIHSGAQWQALEKCIADAKPSRVAPEAWAAIPKTMELETVMAEHVGSRNVWAGEPPFSVADVLMAIGSAWLDIPGIDWYPGCAATSGLLGQAYERTSALVLRATRELRWGAVTNKYDRPCAVDGDGDPVLGPGGATNSNWRESFESEWPKRATIVYPKLAEKKLGWGWAWPCDQIAIPAKLAEADRYELCYLYHGGVGGYELSAAMVDAIVKSRIQKAEKPGEATAT